MEERSFTIGGEVLVFDFHEWHSNGRGSEDKYYRTATITNIYPEPPIFRMGWEGRTEVYTDDLLLDVVFNHNRRVAQKISASKTRPLNSLPNPSNPQAKQERSVEELVKLANEGRQALYELYDRVGNQVEYYDVKANKWNRYKNEPFKGLKYRLAEKKQFKPYVINNLWNVQVHEGKHESKQIQIGCQTFGYYLILDMLKALVNNGDPSFKSKPPIINNPHYQYTEHVFYASRVGIKYNKYYLRWEDAEVLLKKMEEFK